MFWYKALLYCLSSGIDDNWSDTWIDDIYIFVMSDLSSSSYSHELDNYTQTNNHNGVVYTKIMYIEWLLIRYKLLELTFLHSIPETAPPEKRIIIIITIIGVL